jgi:hypothetical protein
MERVLTDIKQLVGMAYDCYPAHHVQPMLWATDGVGIKLLLNPLSLGTCYKDADSAIDAEMRSSLLVTDANYKVDVMMSAYKENRTYTLRCDEEDHEWDDAYYTTNAHPFDTMFTSRWVDEASGALGKMTQWTDHSQYSSYDACKNSPY